MWVHASRQADVETPETSMVHLPSLLICLSNKSCKSNGGSLIVRLTHPLCRQQAASRKPITF